MVKAQVNGTWAAIQLSPTQGQPGSSVSLTGTGFTGNVLIYFGTSASPSLALVGTTSSNSNGAITVFFEVPPESSGSYVVTAQDSAGDAAESSFIVISGPSSAPTSSPYSSSSTSSSSSSSSSSRSSYSYPTVTSLPRSAGFSSTPIIAAVIVIVALAAVVLAFLLQRTRSKREMLLKKEPPSYQSQSPMQTSRLNETPRNGQPPQPQSQYAKPSSQYSNPYAQRYSQKPTGSAATNSVTSSSSYDQQPASGKICPHCKRVIKADYSICPYCDKRLR